MKKTLGIEGMSCEHCVAHVKEALEGVPGVKKVKVSLKDKNAIIELGEEICDDILKSAVTEAGYEVV
jgi:copper chaperone CopZ